MTRTPGDASSKNVYVDFNVLLYLHPSDHFVTTIINFKILGTKNFRVWKNFITRALKDKNKIGFIEGIEIK